MIVIIIIFVALVVMFLYIEYKNPYESDYWGKIGVESYYTYADVLNDFGEPLRVTKTELDSIKVIYDDLIFTFWADSPKALVMNIEVLSTKYRFGYKSIGVGSSKEDVFKAYAHITRSPDKGYI
jgi:hypothetical protein